MLLKEKTVRRQQMLQALVEIQFKAVNAQQTVTIIDTIHIIRNYQQNYQNTESGEKNEGSEIAPEGQAQRRPPYRRQRFLPSYMRRPYACLPQYSNPPVQEVMEGADNQGAGEQGRPVRQNMYGVTDHDSAGALLAKDSLERMAMKRTKNIKEMRPTVSSHLNVGITAPSLTDADAQRTLNHKMAKRQKQPIHQLRIRLLPRLSRAELSKCRLTPSLPSSGLVIQQEKMNMKFQQ